MKDQIEKAIDLVLEQDQDEFLELLKDQGVNYTVRPDGIVDVELGVSLSYMNLTKIPVQFGVVTGYFECSYNKLTSLEGSPEEVGGFFDCSYNQLTTLQGAPEKVGENFYCSHNQLTTLRGCPEEVGGEFICTSNPVEFTEEDIELAKQGKAPLGLPLSFVLMKKKEKEAMRRMSITPELKTQGLES